MDVITKKENDGSIKIVIYNVKNQTYTILYTPNNENTPNDSKRCLYVKKERK